MKPFLKVRDRFLLHAGFEEFEHCIGKYMFLIEYTTLKEDKPEIYIHALELNLKINLLYPLDYHRNQTGPRHNSQKKTINKDKASILI